MIGNVPQNSTRKQQCPNDNEKSRDHWLERRNSGIINFASPFDLTFLEINERIEMNVGEGGSQVQKTGTNDYKTFLFLQKKFITVLRND